VCVLHSIERHCEGTVQSRDAVSVLHSVESHFVCNVQCREPLYVYCTV